MTNNKNKRLWSRLKRIALILSIIVAACTLLTTFFGDDLFFNFFGKKTDKMPQQKSDKLVEKQIEKDFDERNKSAVQIENLSKIEESSSILTLVKEIESEGLGEDMFDENIARKLARDKALITLISKFPKEKEGIVRRLAKTKQDTVMKTEKGIWRSLVVLSVNEFEIID